MTVPRPDYPRPQFVRGDWLNLNGSWQFEYDDANAGLTARWYERGTHAFSRQITVPFAYQSPLSGIGDLGIHDLVWYARDFDVPQEWSGKRLLLHFGAVDYRAWVWVNGTFAGFHEGGHVPFTLDVTQHLTAGNNFVALRIEDLSTDKAQPRGKQDWEIETHGCWYHRTTGIWQTVWLEPVGAVSLADIRITPDVDTKSVSLEYFVSGAADGVEVETEITFFDDLVTTQRVTVEAGQESFKHSIALGDDVRLWSPDSPDLYDLTIRLKRGSETLDTVTSYFGMRKIAIENGQIMFNNAPIYLKMILDQGYNPEGRLSFPSDDYIKRDIEFTKAFGFNGARKHQKVEDPRYYYWADRLGLLVWAEMANTYAYSETSVQRITAEWIAAVRRDYNHPCIIAWTPLNESWGVPDLTNDPRQRHHLMALYHITKSLDPVRPVITNDGWEHADSDFVTIHDYEGKGEVIRERYATLESTLAYKPANRPLYAPGFAYQGQPILFTEFGGIGFRNAAQEGWGYTDAQDPEDFIERYRAVVDATFASKIFQGFCYTQLTDVEQEVNGLLTYDRQPKVDPAIIRKINQSA